MEQIEDKYVGIHLILFHVYSFTHKIWRIVSMFYHLGKGFPPKQRKSTKEWDNQVSIWKRTLISWTEIRALAHKYVHKHDYVSD